MSASKERKTAQLGLRLAPSLKAALERLAVQEDRTVSQVTARILSEHLQREYPHLLAGGSEPPAEPEATPAQEGGAAVMLPVYQVHPGARVAGFPKDAQRAGFHRLGLGWLEEHVGVKPEVLFVTPVLGDAMEPTLRPGGTVLVQRLADEAPRQYGIYLMEYGGELLLRWVKPTGDVLELSGDNEAYPAFTLPADAAGRAFRVIGRIVWSWGPARAADAR